MDMECRKCGRSDICSGWGSLRRLDYRGICDVCRRKEKESEEFDEIIYATVVLWLLVVASN